jgi:hypothetical protein
MFNANNVLDLLVEALREGGEVRLREFAKTYATENLGQINEEALTEVLNEILAALNNFDKAAALAVVEGAQERIRFVEEDSADDEDEDEETDEDSDQPDLAGRVTALEAEVARLKEIASRYV